METTIIEPVKENQLQAIVRESDLAPAKAKVLLENFQNYFEVASEWESKAKAIVVTSPLQKEDMALAREGRLELKEKRLAVERVRKVLKEQSLREGKAIDGIANVLKALIVPIEDYLEKQERFVEIQEEKKLEAKRLEIERRMAEEERLAQEKAAAEQERLRQENEKLKKDAEEVAKKVAEEKKKQEDAFALEIAQANARLEAENKKAEAERRAIEDKAKMEKAKADAKLRAEREKADAARRDAEETARRLKERERAKLEAERKEKERLEEILKNQIQCPKCQHKFSIKKESI